MRFFALAASRLFLGSGEGVFSLCEVANFPYQKCAFLPWRLAGYFWALEMFFSLCEIVNYSYQKCDVLPWRLAGYFLALEKEFGMRFPPSSSDNL